MKVIKVGAIWCPGCLVMKPIWAKIEEKRPWLHNEFYDYDQNPEVVAKYKINEELPVFIFLDKNGNEFLRLTGEHTEGDLEKIVDANKNR